MKERPIIMAGENPKLIFEGRKTQTRRIIKPQPIQDGTAHEWKGLLYDLNTKPNWMERKLCPYGVAGDRLWVREAWGLPPRYDPKIHGNLQSEPAIGPVCFKADYNNRHAWDGAKWRPSIHMPRWASRITLEILKVRVERLQDISEEDAMAEGMRDCSKILGHHGESARFDYQLLWDSLHGKGAWDKNPWVWVIEFKKK